MDLGLEGRVAFVAGASRGLGRAIARRLAEEGCRVAITARGREALEATALEIGEGGRTVIPIPADVTKPVEALAAIERTRRELGEIDVLVLNAGGSRGDKTSLATEEDWEQVLEVNFLAHVRLCRAVSPAMKARGSGAILTISSIYGREWGGAVTYNASKAAMIAFTKSLARELASSGVRVNSLAPGSILFPGGSWDRKNRENPEAIARFVEAEMPRGSFGRDDEIADVAAFLCSDRASLVVGACLNVDGGQSRSLF